MSYLPKEFTKRNNNFSVENISNAFIVEMSVVTKTDNWKTIKISVKDTNDVAILLNEYFMLPEND